MTQPERAKETRAADSSPIVPQEARASAEQGEFLAQIELARIFARGLGVAVDAEAALKWYSAALAQESCVGGGEDIEESKAYVNSFR